MGSAVINSVTTTGTNPTLAIGNTLTVVLSYSANISVNTVGGTPFIALDNGGKAIYSAHTGRLVTFVYTVSKGDGATGTSDVDAVSGINLNGGSIRNGSNNAATSLTTPTDFRELGSFGVACFTRGTMIETPAGAVAIETLAAGSLVSTLEQGPQPIKWIGTTEYEAGMGDLVAHALPVIIRAGALEDGIPSRDLRVSPQHALYIDGVLVPAVGLVNGVSILRDESGDAVEYFHIELDRHNIIISEGVASESFLDMDSRAMFDNASEFDRLHGDATVDKTEFAPRVEEGYLLAAMRKRFALRAGVTMPDAGMTGDLHGYVESLRDGVLLGWAFDATAAQTGVEIEAVVDGEVVGRTVANRYRYDLLRAGMGSGNCCFTLAMPASVTSLDQVTVRRATDGVKLVHLDTQTASA